MNHLVVAAILAAMAGLGGPARDDIRSRTDGRSGSAGPALVTHNPAIQASLDRLWRASPSWRAALDAVSLTGRRAVLLTPEQVVVRDSADSGDSSPFDSGVLGEVSPVVNSGGAVDVVLVVINLPLIEAAHDDRGSLPAELHDDLDGVIAHEVFGHAVPYLLAGSVAGRCADPQAGQRAVDACAIQRENVVRRELGLSRRTDAGINGLMLAFRGRR
ncbi:MAG: hypothetical protein R2712_11270 [Vicinamibacterales bacterium]